MIRTPRGRLALVVFSLILMTLGVVIWFFYSAPSSPPRKAGGLLEAFIEGDFAKIWSYAREEELAKLDKEAFKRVYSRIVYSHMKGWELDGPSSLSWEFGGAYAQATAWVKCGNGVRFKAQAWFKVKPRRSYTGVMVVFLTMLTQYVAARDGVDLRVAGKKCREEFREIFHQEGIREFYDFEDQSWKPLWDTN